MARLVEYCAVLLRGDEGDRQTLRAEAPGTAHLHSHAKSASPILCWQVEPEPDPTICNW